MSSSEIGQALRSLHTARHALSAFALALVIADLCELIEHTSLWRFMPTLLTLLVFGFVSRWDLRSLGLTFAPAQGWHYWCLVSLIVGAGMGIVLLVSYGVTGGLASELPLHDASFLRRWLWRSILFYPVVEEGLYRFTLCTPTTAILGDWPTIMLSGLAFAFLHVAYDNVAPENLIGGFILAWSFLKSECLVVPIMLHAVGNLCIVLAHVGSHYLNVL